MERVMLGDKKRNVNTKLVNDPKSTGVLKDYDMMMT